MKCYTSSHKQRWLKSLTGIEEYIMNIMNNQFNKMVIYHEISYKQ